MAFAVMATISSGQESSGNESTHFCWRGRVSPKCETFLLTEITLLQGVSLPRASVTVDVGYPPQQTTQVVRPLNRTLSWELGAMTNVGKNTALGMSLLVDVRDQGTAISISEAPTFGLKTRYRRWARNNELSLDLGLGVRNHRDEYRDYLSRSNFADTKSRSSQSAAFVGDVTLNAADLVALTARVDLARLSDKREPRISAGVRLGSYPAAGVTGTLLLVAGVIALVFTGWD